MIKDKQESNAHKAKGEKLQKHIVTEVKSASQTMRLRSSPARCQRMVKTLK